MYVCTYTRQNSFFPYYILSDFSNPTVCNRFIISSSSILAVYISSEGMRYSVLHCRSGKISRECFSNCRNSVFPSLGFLSPGLARRQRARILCCTLHYWQSITILVLLPTVQCTYMYPIQRLKERFVSCKGLILWIFLAVLKKAKTFELGFSWCNGSARSFHDSYIYSTEEH